LACTSNVLWQNFYYDYKPSAADDTLEIGKMIKEDAIQDQTTIIYKLRKIFGLTGWIYNKSDDKALDYIKMIINMALSLVWLISLILLIYAFYLMFFSEQEEWLTRAKKIMIWVAIALTVMGISYFIVEFIFYLYKVSIGETTWETAYQIIKLLT